MNFDMTFIYTSSLNIILLLFIFAAVGYILQDGAHGPFLSKKLYKYIHLMLGIVVISDIWLIVESNFWRLSMPIYQYKLFLTIILIIVSVLFERSQTQKFIYRSIVTVTLFMIIYSLSFYIESYSNA